MHLEKLTTAAGVAAAVVIATAAAGAPRAHAQAPPAGQPPAQQQQPAPWYRFTLTDGRVVDGQWVGGNAQSYFVQTTGGTFSIARENVLGAVPLMASAPQAPPSVTVVPPPRPVVYVLPVAEEKPSRGRSRMASGLGLFASTYFITAMVALVARNQDRDASLGLIPVAGPLLWTQTRDDNEEWREDTWNWLALASSIAQAGSLIIAFTDLGDPSKRTRILSVSPVTGRNFGGVALAGSF
jgi:hypothetical protein